MICTEMGGWGGGDLITKHGTHISRDMGPLYSKPSCRLIDLTLVVALTVANNIINIEPFV